MLRNGGATFPNLLGSEELGNLGFPTIGSGSITVFGLDIPYAILIFVVLALLSAAVVPPEPAPHPASSPAASASASKRLVVRFMVVPPFLCLCAPAARPRASLLFKRNGGGNYCACPLNTV